VSDYGWKQLAALLAESHENGGDSLFIFSGLSTRHYPRAGLEQLSEVKRVAGRELSKRTIRKWLWERFRGNASPTTLPREQVVWTVYDQAEDASYLGAGKITLAGAPLSSVGGKEQ
jgi:hypothetical protein